MVEPVDVAIVGGGPAGLSCALVLGRACRSVVLFDDGQPRNERAHAMHGFLTREGTRPEDMRVLGRAELAPYDVEIRDEHVGSARRVEDGFELTLASGECIRARKLVLATGMVDEIPDLPGVDALLGTSVHTCPYCDGWEERGKRLAAFAPVSDPVEFALGLTTWSDDVVLFTDGRFLLTADEKDELAEQGIGLREGRVERVEGEGGRLKTVCLASGERIARDAMFVHFGCKQRSRLPASLGVTFMSTSPMVDVGELEGTGIPGLYVVGDASRDVQFAIVAAAEGAKAAYAINRELRIEAAERSVRVLHGAPVRRRLRA